MKESPVEDQLFILEPSEPSLPTYRMKAVDPNSDFARQAWVKEIVDAKEGLGSYILVFADVQSSLICAEKAHFLCKQISNE